MPKFTIILTQKGRLAWQAKSDGLVRSFTRKTTQCLIKAVHNNQKTNSKSLETVKRNSNEILKQVPPASARNPFQDDIEGKPQSPHSPRPLRERPHSGEARERGQRNHLVTQLLNHPVTSPKPAFTLAEVLITLAIIGVVAMLIIKPLAENITERINSYREANIALKVTNAMELMQREGLLAKNYSSTDEFVDVLQRYLKVIKRCNASNIDKCWPTAKVRTSDGEEFEIKDAIKGRNLNIWSNKTDNVGLVLADGASIILTYDQNSEPIDTFAQITATKKSLPGGFGTTVELAYTSSSTAPIDFIMDVNGGRGPNSETIDNKYYDIRSFKGARLGQGCTWTNVRGFPCVQEVPGPFNYDQAQNACAPYDLRLPEDASEGMSLISRERRGPYWTSYDIQAWSGGQLVTNLGVSVKLNRDTESFIEIGWDLENKNIMHSVLCIGD